MHPKIILLCCAVLVCSQKVFCWGFFAHKQINRHAVFLLPPAMLAFYKPHLDFLTEHAVDPDKRRYIVTIEGPRHFIDLNHYGAAPFPDLPRGWPQAVEKYGEDSLSAHGVVPWWIQTMLNRLTTAFREKDYPDILKLSAEIGHYMADAHVPLHAHSNYNGQQTGQQGIHGLWESRIPELLTETEFDFFIGRAQYLSRPQTFIWQRVLESAAAADTVLAIEKKLTTEFSPTLKYAFEERNGVVIRQYSSAFAAAYNTRLKGMVERRMRQAVFAVASLWYTAWINAGQPKMEPSSPVNFSEEDQKKFEDLDRIWKSEEPESRTLQN